MISPVPVYLYQRNCPLTTNRTGRKKKRIDLVSGLPYTGVDSESFPEGGAMFFVVRLIINMVAILIISYLFPKTIWVDGFLAALVAAFLLGVVNAIIRPVLVFLTLPLTVVTLGLFLLVVNGLMLWLVSALVRGFHVSGFWGAVLGSILISIVSWILSRFLPS
jgi:putative membrane protein